ncbi:hypothetical protein CVT25_000477 [Psilocybe cyanescens]|uniref:Uncharacterized protein n=1 Tax=Psilocybe cyanescens TaxID=93625 RepID=A0A409XW91_PSICY|nr:hypothetical protein CVT25_000477 [Psilocybe cyanescens]
MAAGVQGLPTEILCAIFELSTIGLTTETSHIESRSLTRRRRSTYPIVSGPKPIALPSHKQIFLHCITISHVCKRWRYIAIDLHDLWTRIHLCHNAFISKNYNDSQATETTSMFLSRSANLPLYLDITFALNDPLALSWIQKSRYEENIRRVLLPHIGRCLSLRLVSSDFIVTAVLDVFLERNLSSSPNDIGYTPLSHLHLAKVAPSSRRGGPDSPDHGHGQPIYPPDLSIVAPHLKSLYIDDVQIAVFPRWCLETLFLNNTFISYQNHFHVFMKTRITMLVLHRVTIPGGLPYVRRLIAHHASSVRSLCLSELRCGGPEAEHEDMYTLFFALSLYRTLRELELSGLSQDAMSGLSLMLSANSALVFTDMQKLILRSVKLEATTVADLTTSFPALNELVLERMDEGSDLVNNSWKGNPAIWPELTEIHVDDKMVKRIE